MSNRKLKISTNHRLINHKSTYFKLFLIASSSTNSSPICQLSEFVLLGVN